MTSTLHCALNGRRGQLLFAAAMVINTGKVAPRLVVAGQTFRFPGMMPVLWAITPDAEGGVPLDVIPFSKS